MHKFNMDDTIVAISTPVGEGGIGIVRLSGPQALKISDAIFRAKNGEKLSASKTHTVHYGHIVDVTRVQEYKSTRAQAVDEVLVTVMRAPKTYTKEDIVEINCHGGMQAVKRVVELAVLHGGRVAEPGEFTKRAFLNGRIDLTQAEAVLDVIRSKTEGSLKVAMDQLEGHLARSVKAVREAVMYIAAEVEASIDFPEEDLELSKKKELVDKAKVALKEIEDLIKSYDNGMVYREGVLAIICGKPNVGKSSLMNLLLKRDRVIVSPIPGTTRDAVEEIISLNGIPVRLVDTAGISETKDILEKEGIKRSKKYLELSDIVILMLDASTSITKADRGLMKLIGGKKKLVVVNKIDAPRKAAAAAIKKLFKKEEVVNISVKKKENIKELEDAICRAILKGGMKQGEGAIVSNARQKEALDKARKSMLSVTKAITKDEPPDIISIDLNEAIASLGLVTGESVSDDILDRIFSQFCIGK